MGETCILEAVKSEQEIAQYPIYFLQGAHIYLEVISPTEVVQVYGHDYGNNKWEWYSARFDCPEIFVNSLATNPDYRRITETEFQAIWQQYLDFHRKLVS